MVEDELCYPSDEELTNEDIDIITANTFSKHCLNVCGCSDNSIYFLFMKSESERIRLIDERQIVGGEPFFAESIRLGLKEIVKDGCIDYINLNLHGKELVCWCIDFLKYEKKMRDTNKTEYITLFRFVCKFLNIKADSGYDYWLMNYLENMHFIEHGIAIRCAWIYDPNGIFSDRKISEERACLFDEWIKQYVKDIL